MVNSIDSSDAGPSEPARRHNVLRYGALLAGLGGIRIFELATSGSYFRLMAFESTAAWIATSVLAAAACYFATCQLRKYYPPAIAILISVVLGAAITLIASSFPGMIVGFAAGLIATFEILRSFTSFLLKAFGWIGLPAALVGGLVGYLGATTGLTRPANVGSEFRLAVIVLAFLAVVGVIWVYFLGLNKRKENGAKPLGDFVAFAAFLSMAASACIGGVEFDNHQRVRNSGMGMGGVGGVPLGYQSLVRGLSEPTYLMLLGDISPKVVERLSPFRSISNMYCSSVDYSGGQDPKQTFRYEELKPLDLSNLINIHAYGSLPSGWTDEGLNMLSNSDKVNCLMLPVSQVTDEGLSVLKGMRLLSELNLKASQVRGDGLRHLHKKVRLLSLVLSGSPTNDRVFEVISSPSLLRLELAGTEVTGTGLENAKLPGLVTFDVANSRFAEANAAFIPPSVRDINLSGIPLSTVGTKMLSQRQSIRKLELINTGVNDQAILNLGNCTIYELAVDATHLTPASSAALAGVFKLELVFEAGERNLDEILDHCEELRDALTRAHGRKFEGGVSSMGGELKLTIAGLTVTREMLPRLRELDIQLSNPTVKPSFGTEPMTVFRSETIKYLVELGAVRAKPLDVHDIEALYETEDRRRKNQVFMRSQAD